MQRFAAVPGALSDRRLGISGEGDMDLEALAAALGVTREEVAGMKKEEFILKSRRAAALKAAGRSCVR